MFASTRAALKTFGFGRAKHPSDIQTREETDTEGGLLRSVRPSVFECYICDSPMVLVEEAPIPDFDDTDLRRHTMRCDTCGMMADRLYHHAIGYDRVLVL